MADPLDEILAPTDPLDQILAAPVQQPTWYQQLGSGVGRFASGAAGLAISPLMYLDPLVRPETGDPQYEEYRRRFLEARGLGRIGEAVGQSVGMVQRPLIESGLIPEQPYDTYLENLGANIAGVLPISAGIVRGAGALSGLATTGASRGSRFVGQIAEQIRSHPVTFTTMNVGAEVGATGARQFQDPYLRGILPGTEYPITAGVGRALLSLPGEMLAGGPTAWVARHLGQMSRVIPRAEHFRPHTVASGPVIPRHASPEEADTIARVHTEQTLDFIDRAILRTIQRAGEPGLTEAQASVRFREGMLSARDFLFDSTQRAYDDLPLHITGNPSNYGNTLEATLDLLGREMQDEAQNWPVDMMRNQLRQLSRTLDDAGETIGWNEVPIRELNLMRRNLIRAQRNSAETNVLQMSNRSLHDNIGYLIGRLDEVIDNIGSSVDPNFQAQLDYAQALYRMYNDRFRRGPVGAMLMRNRHAPIATAGDPNPVPGYDDIAPIQVARQLIAPRGNNDVAEGVHQALTNLVRMSDDPVQASTLANAAMQRGDEAIRTMFANEIADYFENAQATVARPKLPPTSNVTHSLQPGPIRQSVKQATDWIRDNETLLRSWTDTTARIMGTVRSIQRMQETRNAHVRSLVNRFLGQRVENVVEDAMNMPNARAQFQGLHRALGGNPDFLEGMQRALFNHLTRGDGIDPSVALGRMRQPQYMDVLPIFFTRDQLDRMHNIFRDASGILGDAVRAQGGRLSLNQKEALSRGSLGMAGAARFGISRWLFGLGGLMLGNIAHRVLPLMGQAGALGIPAKMSGAARNLIAGLWVKDRVNAMNHIREAVFDPGIEALLRDAAPGNYKDLQNHFLKVSRQFRRMEALVNSDVDAMVRGNGPELLRQQRQQQREEEARIRRSPYGGGR